MLRVKCCTKKRRLMTTASTPDETRLVCGHGLSGSNVKHSRPSRIYKSTTHTFTTYSSGIGLVIGADLRKTLRRVRPLWAPKTRWWWWSSSFYCNKGTTERKPTNDKNTNRNITKKGTNGWQWGKTPSQPLLSTGGQWGVVSFPSWVWGEAQPLAYFCVLRRKETHPRTQKMREIRKYQSFACELSGREGEDTGSWLVEPDPKYRGSSSPSGLTKSATNYPFSNCKRQFYT